MFEPDPEIGESRYFDDEEFTRWLDGGDLLRADAQLDRTKYLTGEQFRAVVVKLLQQANTAAVDAGGRVS
jgi:hypothetical protein